MNSLFEDFFLEDRIFKPGGGVPSTGSILPVQVKVWIYFSQSVD